VQKIRRKSGASGVYLHNQSEQWGEGVILFSTVSLFFIISCEILALTKATLVVSAQPEETEGSFKRGIV
jgi:hypothetical protein